MTEALRRLVMDPVLVAIVVGKRAGNDSFFFFLSLLFLFWVLSLLSSSSPSPLFCLYFLSLSSLLTEASVVLDPVLVAIMVGKRAGNDPFLSLFFLSRSSFSLLYLLSSLSSFSFSLFPFRLSSDGSLWIVCLPQSLAAVGPVIEIDNTDANFLKLPSHGIMLKNLNYQPNGKKI
jgi:hypothetical protein